MSDKTKDTNLAQLTISSDDNKSQFTAPINPESYKHSYQNSYSVQDAAQGNAGKQLKFTGAEPQTISFDLMLDDTGVIYPFEEGKDIISRINELKNIVYNYNGEYHRPNQVIIDWNTNFLEGQVQYRWRLQTMNISFSLFAMDGRPLRAKISLDFRQSLTFTELQQLTNNESPDMTHYRVVKIGDTLPMMCYSIYQDPSYYIEIAKVNNLINFRNLALGIELEFPPIQKLQEAE